MSMTRSSLPVPCLFGLALLFAVDAPTSVRAQESVKVESIDRLAAEAFALNDLDPESSVPTPEQAMRRPLQMGYFVMLLIERGAEAEKKSDHVAAIKYYRAMAKAVPERSQAFTLLCRAYAAAGEIDAALETCRTALGKPGVRVDDNLRFVNLMLRKQGELSAKDIEDVEAIATHLESEVKDDGAKLALQVRCDLAMRLEDVPRLEKCTEALRESEPTDPKTLAISWALALKKEDLAGAQVVVGQAKSLALPAPAIAKMESGLQAARAHQNTLLRRIADWRFVAGFLACVAGLCLALWSAREKRAALRDLPRV